MVVLGSDCAGCITLVVLEIMALEVATGSLLLDVLVGSGIVFNGGLEFAVGEEEESRDDSTIGKAIGACVELEAGDGLVVGAGLGAGDGLGDGNGSGVGDGLSAGWAVDVGSSAGGGVVFPIVGGADWTWLAFYILVEIHPRLSSHHSLLQLHPLTEFPSHRLSWDCLYHRSHYRNPQIPQFPLGPESVFSHPRPLPSFVYS